MAERDVVFVCGPTGPRLSLQQRAALAYLRRTRGWVTLTQVAGAVATSEHGAARTLASLVTRQLAERRMHHRRTYYRAVG